MERRAFTKVAVAVATAAAAGKVGLDLIEGPKGPAKPAAVDDAASEGAPGAQAARVAPAPSRPRRVARVIPAARKLEGAGFPVRRPFPTQRLRHFDPFVLLDEMGPIHWPPGKALGAPAHPHRGFETVSYILEGGVEHADSLGHKGTLGPGGVQWMTAGSGIVHAEEPPSAMKQAGGRMHGFQLWVNLPRRLKMTTPRYQEVQADQFPEATSADGLAKVRVIAGEALGVQARIDVHTPIVYQHWIVQPGGRVTQPMPAGHNACLYVFRGAGVTGAAGTAVGEGDMAQFARDAVARAGQAPERQPPASDSVTFAVPSTAQAPMQALLLAGAPHGDPIVQYGPFVMNSMAEIRQAFADYRAGRMGRIG